MCPFFPPKAARQRQAARPPSSSEGGIFVPLSHQDEFSTRLRGVYSTRCTSRRRPRTGECYADPIGTQVVRGACETFWKWRENLQTKALRWQPANRCRDKGILAPETYPV